MSKPDFHYGVCPLQDAIAHFGLASVIAQQNVTRLMVSSVQFMPDVEPRDAVLPTFEDLHHRFIPPRPGQYGDLVVVFKVLEKSQE